MELPHPLAPVFAKLVQNDVVSTVANNPHKSAHAIAVTAKCGNFGERHLSYFISDRNSQGSHHKYRYSQQRSKPVDRAGNLGRNEHDHQNNYKQ